MSRKPNWTITRPAAWVTTPSLLSAEEEESFTYGHRLAYTVSDMLLSGQIPGDLSSSESYDDDGTAEVDIESQYMDKLERRQAYIEKGANSHLAQALALQGTPKAPVESPTTQPTVDPAAANKTDTSA